MYKVAGKVGRSMIYIKERAKEVKAGCRNGTEIDGTPFGARKIF